MFIANSIVLSGWPRSKLVLGKGWRAELFMVSGERDFSSGGFLSRTALLRPSSFSLAACLAMASLKEFFLTSLSLLVCSGVTRAEVWWLRQFVLSVEVGVVRLLRWEEKERLLATLMSGLSGRLLVSEVMLVLDCLPY